MNRACSDCGKPIDRRSKGRCRSCACRENNRSPEVRAATSARITQMNRARTGEIRKRGDERDTSGRWCPGEYAELNRKMCKEGFSLEERQRIIGEDIEVRLRRLERRLAA